MYDLEKMCFFCLEHSDSTLNDFHSKLYDNSTHFEKISYYLPKISPFVEQNVNNKICKTCSEFLVSIYQFNERCINNINTFNSYKSVLEENAETERDNARIVKKVPCLKIDEPNMTNVNIEALPSSISNNELKLISENDVKKEIEEFDIFEALPVNTEHIKTETVEGDVKEECFGSVNEDFWECNNQEKGYGEETKSDFDVGIEERLHEEVPEKVLVRSNENNVNVIKNSLATQNELSHTGEKPYKCDVCNRSFQFLSHLVIHTSIHTGERPYSCDVCQKTFSLNSHLITHKRIHTGGKTYTCTVCYKLFRHESQFIVHKRIHTGEKPYTCKVCKKSFPARSRLNVHKRIHTGEKPYSCDVCQKSFSGKSYLINHKLTHTGEKPFSCDTCKKSYKNMTTLNRHKRSHTGELPHSCDICHKAFGIKFDLNIHKLIHTGERPYSCDVCSKRFIAKSKLKRHKRIHTDEKPYSCDQCQKAFREMAKLNIHKRIHTRDKPYSCNV